MPRRSAFTLIEVMVALAVSGIVLLGARAMLEATADRANSITRAAAAADRAANAERLLRALTERLEVGTVPGSDFAGNETSAGFMTWCDVPGGWQERCTATLELVRDGDVNSLMLRTSLGDSVRLRSGFRGGSLQFLSNPDAGGTWIKIWGAGITAPVAIGIFFDRDTLILRVGERG